ncbi:hypothetical protein IFHNHDMJ_00407 [Synechococcus sp. CBW1107]|nr:hypothetical protein IFHNHDMJ_00407 [Synechococcus sp. CBW1107]
MDRRLNWDDLDASAFKTWLDAEPSVAILSPETWIPALNLCRNTLRHHWDLPLLPYDPNGRRPFQDIWWPVCLCLEQWLNESIRTPSFIAAGVCGQLADSLLDRLCSLTDQVFWQVFNDGRGPGAILLAHLCAEGDSSSPPVRELYEKFVQNQRRDGLDELLSHYPVLARLIGSVVTLWKEGSLEMLARIEEDRGVLEQKFGILRSFELVSVKQGLGDPHRGGRAVAILAFAEKPDAVIRVVYKPRDMGLDAAYQALLSDLNTNSDLEPLRTLSVHVAGGYGYMEYVSHRLCGDDHMLSKHYANCGRLAAVLHLLGCTDCHHENLIACGDQLLLIDTETLLEADVPDHISDAASADGPAALSALQRRFQRSVLRSGLLPQWMFMSGAKVAVDISALGIAPPPLPEHMVPGWLGINTDVMMPGRVLRLAGLPTSLPVGIGADNPFHRFLSSFCAGFARQAGALIAQRQRLLAHGGALSQFAGLQRRIVLRSTRVYIAIQRQQLEAEALQSNHAQALRLEQLARSFLLAETKPLHWPVFAAERRQMQQLDIPFFTHAVDGDALQLDASGSELAGFIHTSGLDAARERLNHLDQEEIAFQLRLIRGAAQARQLRASGTVLASNDAGLNQAPESAAITGLEAATRIAECLLTMAIQDSDGQVEWLGMDLGADGTNFSFGPVGLSLYGGSIGVAVLIKRLHDQGVLMAGADAVQAAILQPLHHLGGQLGADGRRRWWRDQPLGLSGCGGLLLALHVLDEQELVQALVADALPRFIEADQQLDLMGGCAGLIGALLQLGTESALQLAVLAGYHLIAGQSEAGAWKQSPRQPALLGFSHGTAGYAAALARLHTATGEERFRRGAQAALAYERARFNRTQGNWPDLRGASSADDASTFMLGWCHGAPGIALGRACLWGTSLWDEYCAEEISVALATTAAMQTPGTDHLCCGSLGLMVVLRAVAAGPWPLQPDLRANCSGVADVHLNQVLHRCSMQELELRCFGIQEGTLMLPGFFSGLSGMGMALLEDARSQAATLALVSAGLNPPHWASPGFKDKSLRVTP